jgi:hypothetical protein
MITNANRAGITVAGRPGVKRPDSQRPPMARTALALPNVLRVKDVPLLPEAAAVTGHRPHAQEREPPVPVLSPRPDVHPVPEAVSEEDLAAVKAGEAEAAVNGVPWHCPLEVGAEAGVFGRHEGYRTRRAGALMNACTSSQAASRGTSRIEPYSHFM